MTPKENSLLFTAVIAIVCFVIWKYSGIPLSYEMPPDYSVLPHPSDNTDKELLVYFVYSILFSLCIYYPFYLSKQYDQLRLLAGAIISVLFFFFHINYISSNTKGLLLSNWFGDDYGFSIPLIKVFFFSPLIYYVYNIIAFIRLPLSSLIYLYFTTFVIYQISSIIGNVYSLGFIPTIRHILTDGYFIAFYAIAFGLIGMSANKADFNDMKVDYIDDDDNILDSKLD